MNKELARTLYRTMRTIRAFETRVKQLYREGQVFGAIHLTIGQEAIAAGVCAALRKDDAVFSTHRGHGHFIAKGGAPKAAMAELMGKETGCSRGWGGSMHMYDLKRGFMGGSGIVGGGLTLALGPAFAAQYRDTDQVSVVFFGDGASNQGSFHEALNLAALWKLPYIAVCENNRYAATTPMARAMSLERISPRAQAYGIPGVTVDGNDVFAVYDAMAEAVARARDGEGPTLIDCETYRVEPHCGIIADQRPPEELAQWGGEANDPLVKFAKTGVLEEKELHEIDLEAKATIEKAVAFAQDSPSPDPARFFEERGLA